MLSNMYVVKNKDCELLSWMIYGVFITYEFYLFYGEKGLERNFTFMISWVELWIVFYSFYTAKKLET